MIGSTLKSPLPRKFNSTFPILNLILVTHGTHAQLSSPIKIATGQELQLQVFLFMSTGMFTKLLENQ